MLPRFKMDILSLHMAITNEKPITPIKYAPNLFEPIENLRSHNDLWGVDLLYPTSGKSHSYEYTFSELLAELGVKSFQELIEKLSKESQQVHVLDFMGGGYFLPPSQYSFISSMTGFRLSNPEETYFLERRSDIELMTEHIKS